MRLFQGDFACETVYGDDPVAQARAWCALGASRVHVVDLDGARDGELRNRSAIAAITAALDVPVQVGGGVRSAEAAQSLLTLGVDRVVLGTVAVSDPALLERLALAHPGRIALGLDARSGRIATAGWLETSDATPRDLLERFSSLPLAAVIYTDIGRDGTLTGPDLDGLAQLARASSIPVIASGGISRLDDVDGLRAAGVQGLIVGKALYEGILALDELIARAAGGPMRVR